MTFTGKLVATRSRELRHQHREASVADEGDALPSGIGDLARDRVRQSRRHRREIAREVKRSIASDVEMACRPRSDRAGVGGQDRVVARQSVDDAHEVLRLDRIVLDRFERFHLLPPLRHLRFVQIRGRSDRNDVREAAPAPARVCLASPTSGHVGRDPVAGSHRVDLDLDDLGLPGIREVLRVREVRPDHEQGVTAFDRVLRRCGAEQADPSEHERIVDRALLPCREAS